MQKIGSLFQTVKRQHKLFTREQESQQYHTRNRNVGNKLASHSNHRDTVSNRRTDIASLQSSTPTAVQRPHQRPPTIPESHLHHKDGTQDHLGLLAGH